MPACGLNCREDVFGRDHLDEWNVVCVNGDGYNWSMGNGNCSSFESERVGMAEVEEWYE